MEISACKKRKTCKVPCYPIENYLKRDNLTVDEKGQGDTVTLYPRSREEQRSNLSTGADKDGDPRFSSKEAIAFSTEAVNPFRHYEVNHKQISVFIKRFFGKWSYEDIAKAHDISTDSARKLYYAGVQKLVSVIIEMGQVKKMTPEERKRAEVAKSKWYLERNRKKVNVARRSAVRQEQGKNQRKKVGAICKRKIRVQMKLCLQF